VKGVTRLELRSGRKNTGVGWPVTNEGIELVRRKGEAWIVKKAYEW
jgi:hypothetical protein